MRQRLTIILTFVVIIGVLALINTVTHIQEAETRDLEVRPNRSSYHSGPTGTRALYDFLSESGFKVMRWREPLTELQKNSGHMVSTLVVVGQVIVPFDDKDHKALNEWVANGGRLILIDRFPTFAPITTEGWAINTKDRESPTFDTDPGNIAQMTTKVTELKPVQPTLLTNKVESVLPSRFATRFVVTAVPTPSPTPVAYGIGPAIHQDDTVLGSPSPEPSETESDTTIETESTPPPQAVRIAEDPVEDDHSYESPYAPVVHVGDSGGAAVLDYAYGSGRIVLVSDPYLVTNSGIRLRDNLTLAINLVGGPKTPGLIAFDEYHQGRGVTRNAFAHYFAGTPVLAIGGQIVLLVLVVLWTNGRRFARPLPLPQVDRRSSLEFVESMAELQERSRAFDLAIENIYTRTRRVLARYAGVDYNSSRAEIATRIAERSTIDRHELEALMQKCEDAINGQPISSRESIQLVRSLRKIERDLGLRMRSRDERQAAEKI